MMNVKRAVRRAWLNCGDSNRRRVFAIGAVILLLAVARLLWSGAPPVAARLAHFPRVPPVKLAHMLADFTVHARLYQHIGEWTIDAESGNFSTWRYSVSFHCGARCSGRAQVVALDQHAHVPALAHVTPPAHRVLVARRACTHAPLLPWVKVCDEWESQWDVTSDGAGGAELRERSRGVCGGGFARRLLRAPPCDHAPPLAHLRAILELDR